MLEENPHPISPGRLNGASEIDIARYAREQGLPSLGEDGVLKLLGGAVSLSDLLSVGMR